MSKARKLPPKDEAPTRPAKVRDEDISYKAVHDIEYSHGRNHHPAPYSLELHASCIRCGLGFWHTHDCHGRVAKIEHSRRDGTPTKREPLRCTP